jgi:hypothetical protein
MQNAECRRNGDMTNDASARLVSARESWGRQSRVGSSFGMSWFGI